MTKIFIFFWQSPQGKMVNFQLKEKKDLLVALDYLDEKVEKKDVMCVKKRKKRARKLLKQQ